MNLNELRAVIDMASAHIEDIRSGLAEGIYEPEENRDLPAKCKALELVMSGYMARLYADESVEVPEASVAMQMSRPSRVFVHRSAEATVSRAGLDRVLAWFRQPAHREIGSVHTMGDLALQAYFGADHTKVEKDGWYILIVAPGFAVQLDASFDAERDEVDLASLNRPRGAVLH